MMTSIAGALLLASCGGDVEPISFDSIPTETTVPFTIPPTSSAPAVTSTAAGTQPAQQVPWRDATGNLAGLESECQNLSLVSARPGGGIVAGVALQGLWGSTNGGQDWTRLGEGSESAELTFRLTSVVYDPEDPERAWVTGAFNGLGVYVTEDGGDTFAGVGAIYHVGALAIDFGDSDRSVLLAPEYESSEAYLSVDGGAEWTPLAENLPDHRGQWVGAAIMDEDTYLLGARRGTAPGVYRTTNGGRSWRRVHSVDVAGTPVQAQDGRLYWLLDRGGGLIRTDDGGATWESIPSRSISPFATSFVELPDGRFVTISSTNLIASDDHGIEWHSIGPALPYEPSGLVYSEVDGAFYIWRSDCDFLADNPVRTGAVMRLDFPLGDDPSEASTPRPPASTDRGDEDS